LDLSAKFGDRNLYEVPPEDIARRLAQSGKFHVRDYAVLFELVKWREDRVRELNVPRRWLAEDGVLIDLAKIKPTTVDQLQGFRGLSRGEAKLPQAKKILSAIEAGSKSKDEIPKDLKERKTLQPSSEESLGIDLLRVLLSLLSDQYSIASKHIVPPQSLLPLIRLHPETVEALQASGLVSQQLGDQGMQKLFSFLRGEAALSFDSKGKRVQLS
jgi:ribonuclease D